MPKRHRNFIINLLFLIAIYIGPPIFAQNIREFSPYVIIHNTLPNSLRQWSGVIINQDDEFYYVLTCNHGIEDLKPDQIDLQTTIFPADNNYPLKSCAIQTFIIKQDQSRDLSYIKFYKIDYKITPLTIAQNKLESGTKVLSYGYVNRPPLIKNPVTVSSYEKYMYGNIPVLSCFGKKISGMSGGPLIFNNKIYGIQSTADDGYVLYIPNIEINNFIKE